MPNDLTDINAWIQLFLQWLAIPEQGMLALALVAFLAASVVPLSSEAVLLGVLAAQPHQFVLALCVATLANTLGSVTTYWLGRVGKKIAHPARFDKHVLWFERYGAVTLFFAWVPWLGDGLVLAAGWLKLNAWTCTAWIALGKLARYAVLTAAVI